MPHTISTNAILKQLKADMIGKDSHRGVTLTYAWLANQFGHFSLGFIPVFILFQIFSKSGSSPTVAMWSCIVVCSFWFAFEVFNFVAPLIAECKSKTTTACNFQPAWQNIAFDTVTDVLFFWFGALSSSTVCSWSSVMFFILILNMAALVYPVRYWFLTKLYLQEAKFPFQMRLSQWDYAINTMQLEKLSRFTKHKDGGMHLLLFGENGSGIDKLAVAVATERSIAHHTCHYTTAVKFFNDLQNGLFSSGMQLWDWQSCDTLVIDDVDHTVKDREELITPTAFMDFLTNEAKGIENRECIRQANVIWVLGGDSYQQKAEKWSMMLRSIGVSEEMILAVQLGEESVIGKLYQHPASGKSVA